MYPFMASLSKGSVNLQSCSLGSGRRSGMDCRIQVHMYVVRALRVKLRSLRLMSFSSSAKWVFCLFVYIQTQFASLDRTRLK